MAPSPAFAAPSLPDSGTLWSRTAVRPAATFRRVRAMRTA